MTTEELLKTIRAEIERRIKFYKTLATAAAEKNLHNTMEANELLIGQCESFLSFLDTLTVKLLDK